MGMFDSLAISATGVGVYRTWLDAISDNIANVNTVRSTSEDAFQARYVVATSVETADGRGAGTAVAGIQLGSAEGRVTSDPTNPLADAAGNVRRPDIDMVDQMNDLILAQRGYQANLAVVDRARDAYTAALQLGRSS